MQQRLSADYYSEGIFSGDRVILSKAITLAESRLAHDRMVADQVLQKLLPRTGGSFRIGITGSPGVGKSTFIEAFGQYLTQVGKKVAVLAVDPSSPRSGGSILGDKTRMEKLSLNPNAFIRPSAAGHTVGGLARHTRETMLLCEAAGYDIVLIETVGVGQSETMVREMTDFFLLITIPGAGDQLQGIKKGIMEMADAIVINKADGPNKKQAANALADYKSALHLLPLPASGFPVEVMLVSALENTHVSAVWELMMRYKTAAERNGFYNSNRQSQNADWLYDHIASELEDRFFENIEIQARLAEMSALVRDGSVHPAQAARTLVDLFIKK